MKKARSLFYWTKYLLLFRRPVFEELEFIDLIIDNKPIFLTAWKIRDGFRLRIKPLKINIVKKEGSLLLKLSSSDDFVDVIASNLWRKNAKRIVLKHITPDPLVASSLIKQFRPLSATHVKKAIVLLNNNVAAIKQATVKSKPVKISLKPGLNIITKNLIYP